MGIIPDWVDRLSGADTAKLDAAKQAANDLRLQAMDLRKQADALEIEANAVEHKATADEVTLHTAEDIKVAVENKPKQATPVEEAVNP